MQAEAKEAERQVLHAGQKLCHFVNDTDCFGNLVDSMSHGTSLSSSISIHTKDCRFGVCGATVAMLQCSGFNRHNGRYGYNGRRTHGVN